MSFANPLSRLSSIIRAPVMVHTASSTESDWFLPYDGPIEPPPPPMRHPFAAEIPQPKAVPPTRSKSNAAKSEPGTRDRSRSRSRDAKRKSQRSYVALDAGGGVGAYPAPEREKDRSSVQSDFTFGAHSAHTSSGHARGQGNPGTVDPQFTFPPTDDSTVSTGGKTSDPPLVFANHPFRMHTGSPPPRSHTASASLSTPWVRTITSSPVPDPAPMRKRTLTYQPGLVSSFGSVAETRVGYRESGAFLDLDAREREKIRPTLLPPSLSLLGKPSAELDNIGVDEHGMVHKSVSSDSYLGLRGQYDMRSHPYATAPVPVRETRFGSVSTTTTTTTGGTGKPPVPPRPAGLKLKSSLKPSMSTPELRVHIPTSARPTFARRTSDREVTTPGEGLGARIPRSAGAGSGSGAAGTSVSGAPSGLEVRTICDALIFARPRFRVAAHEITPPPSPVGEDEREAAKRASVVVGESGLKGLACFPRSRVRSDARTLEKEKEKERQGENKEFKTVAEVLRDRDQLEKEREEWNALGQGSLLNNRTRSLSRSQSRMGGARVGGARPRRETVGANAESSWGTLKLKKSVEMLAATALSQGHGHAPSASVSSSHRRGGGTQGSVSTVSHARGASGSVVSRAHSRADSWGQRVVCGSRSGSSLGEDAPGGHMGQSSEGLLRGTRHPVVEDYPVIDIRPIPVGDTHRARAPPPHPHISTGFGVAGPSARQRLSPGPNHAALHPVQPPPSPGESTIGLALSSPAGAALILPNHPFSHRAGAHPAMEPPVPTGPETIAMRHRHPPRSSGSTERARLDEPNHELRPSRSAPPLPTTQEYPPLHMKFPPGPSRSAPPPEHQHPFVARPVMVSTSSGEVQRMFENAMLKSVVTSSGREWDHRRGSGDSGLGSSVNDHGMEMHRAGGRKVSGSSALAGSSLRGSAFGPPGEFEVDDAPAAEEQEPEQGPPAPAPVGLQLPAVAESEKAVSPMGSVQSPFSLMDSLSPSSRRGMLTRVSSGMIDPALAGTAISPMLSHESSSSSFSSPRPLASIDDIESLRGIFYRPSPVPPGSRLSNSQEGSPPNEPTLIEESTESDNEYGRELTDRYQDQEDWTFGRRPFERQHEPQPLWERRREGGQQPDKTPLRIDLAPGTPSPTSATAPLPPAPIVAAASTVPRSAPASSHSRSYQDVPESVHDSDSQSERSVLTTSSQRATNENLTFGFVRSAQVDLLDVNVASQRQSTALSVIDMYDYDVSVTSSSPNTPLNYQAPPSPFTSPSHHDGFLSAASAGISRPGMDRLVSGFPTPPADGTPMYSGVLSNYFTVDNQTSSRRSADERSCSS